MSLLEPFNADKFLSSGPESVGLVEDIGERWSQKPNCVNPNSLENDDWLCQPVEPYKHRQTFDQWILSFKLRYLRPDRVLRYSGPESHRISDK